MEIDYSVLEISAKDMSHQTYRPTFWPTLYTALYMQTVVISIVTCDVCITAKNCVKVSTVGENISHDAS